MVSRYLWKVDDSAGTGSFGILPWDAYKGLSFTFDREAVLLKDRVAADILLF